MYQLTQADSVIRISDSAAIPFDVRNMDYQEFLAWKAKGNTPKPVDTSSRSDLEATVRRSIDAWAATEKESGFTWDGHQFQSDTAAREALLSIQAGAKGTTFGFWRSTTNENIPDGSPAMITKLVQAMNMRGEAIFAQQQVMKASLAAMDDKQLSDFVPSW